MSGRTDQRQLTPAGRALGERLLPVLPVLAFLATFGVFFLDKGREARTVLGSGRGLLVVAALVAGYLALAWALRRGAGPAWVPPVVLSAVVLGLAAWVVRPYYVDRTGDRQLVSGPVGDADAAAATTAGGVPTTTPAGPVRISTGPLRGLGHDATGQVSIIRAADGSRVLRFEDFDIEGTPDPRLYLVRGSDVEKPGGLELGGLEVNRGQVVDYRLPGDEGGPGWTVLVWCRAFSVPIAHATLLAT